MEYQTIEITEAASKHGNLNLSKCGRNFFPEDVFGPPSKNEGLGKQITIKADGINSIIKTDIPTYRKTGKPRWLFRERAWTKKFVEIHNLKVGDTIVVSRIAKRKYYITPNGKDKTRKEYLIPPTGKHEDLVTLQQAALLVGKTQHNIRDYIQRSRINKYNPTGQRISKAHNGQLRVSLKELKRFLDLLEQDH